MPLQAKNLLSILAIAALANGCCPGSAYRGQGEVHRSCGLFRNFKVHFDVSSLAAGSTASWSFSRFPELDSVIGFTVQSRSGLTCPQMENSGLANVHVRLELRDEERCTVAAMSAPLSEWVWSYGGRGESGCNIYADSLYFRPSRSAEYTLEFTTAPDWPSDAVLDFVHIGSYASYSL